MLRRECRFVQPMRSVLLHNASVYIGMHATTSNLEFVTFNALNPSSRVVAVCLANSSVHPVYAEVPRDYFVIDW